MVEGIQSAIKAYAEINHRCPRQIIIYRDGMGGTSMVDKCERIEVPTVLEAIRNYSGSMKDANVTYCFVNQKLNQRLFVKNNGNYINAGAGTVVDTQIVKTQEESRFDFYLVPHSATVATALPVHFDVKYNDCQFDKQAFETLTYHLCYNYFNFAGGIKVPNVVKYAEKLANYSVDVRGIPNGKLNKNLHFL